MPPLTSTRTLIELRVGSIHTIEVLLQIRLSDIHWWNSNYAEYECELYKLIGRRILPKECRHEIEVDRARVREAAEQKKLQQLTSKVDDEGVIVVEKRNSTKRNAVAEKNNSKNTVAGKKRGGGVTKAGKKESKATSKKSRKQDTNTITDAAADTTKKQQSTKNNSSSNDTSESTKDEKKLKLLRETGTWIMGTTIQLCYMMEDIDWSSVSTLIFRPNDNSSTSTDEIEKQQSQSSSKIQPTVDDDDGSKSMVVPLASFRTWKKLPKRVILWVFQFDPNDPTDLSTSTGGGFPRPELLPIADIFRSTTTGDDYDDG
jgi:hypothetical protein